MPVSNHTPSWKQGFARYGHLSAAPGLWKGLVGSWVSGLGPTGLTLRDVSNHGNHGTLTNMDPTDWVTTGQRGIPWALDFDGDNDYIVPAVDIDYTDYETISLWLKLGATNDIYGIIGNLTGELQFWDSYGRGLQYDNGTLYAMGETNNSNAKLSCALADTNWHHVAATFTANGALYLDGKLVDSGSLDGGWDPYRFAIGVNLGVPPGLSYHQWFLGQISHVCLYDRVLAPSEIQQLHEKPMDLLRKRPVTLPAAVAAAVGNPWYHYANQAAIVG